MKILILGSTGKMGTALAKVYEGGDVVGLSSKDFDAGQPAQVEDQINEHEPDLVFNCVAMLGIDPCELHPSKAFGLNALYPRQLAWLGRDYDFTLVHFSTDAVFPDRNEGYWTEDDTPQPVNVYGATKYAGDCLVMAENPDAYIIRLPLLFGPSKSKPQFVEKMLAKAAKGEALKIAADIVCSPTYNLDAAKEILELTSFGFAPGLYHIANAGRSSLCGLITWLVDGHVETGLSSDFPHVGRKNMRTQMRSDKIDAMRPWQEAATKYKETL